VPVVTTYHGSDINKPSILRFSKIAMRLSAHNIFVSARSASMAMGNGQWAIDKETNRQSPIANSLKKRSTLLPCGVNLPKPWSELQTQRVDQLTLNQWVQEKLQSDAKNVLFAGAFDNAVKDPELAFATIQVSNMAIGNRQWEMESNSQSPIANRPIKLIELKGYTRDQVNAMMYNCDVLLLTSKSEGSPQVVKEAMACGCPIVSVDVGDVAERTSGVEGCYIVRTRETKNIAEALLKAIAFDGKTKGRDRILEMGLSNEQVAERLIAIYEGVLA
jgi:glycosyltransferase involved in cell wall biosynthesis